MSNDTRPLSTLKVTSGTTVYIGVPIRDGTVGAQVVWKDNASSGTITVELSSNPDLPAARAGEPWEWKDTGLTFAGPAGAQPGSTLINIENVRQRQARIRFAATADSYIEVWDGTAA